eukprot:1303166-Prymnesium_polylepis.1
MPNLREVKCMLVPTLSHETTGYPPFSSCLILNVCHFQLGQQHALQLGQQHALQQHAQQPRQQHVHARCHQHDL